MGWRQLAGGLNYEVATLNPHHRGKAALLALELPRIHGRMGERGQLDDKIAELLALLNAPDGKLLEDPGDAGSESRPEDPVSDDAYSPDQAVLPDQPFSDQSFSEQSFSEQSFSEQSWPDDSWLDESPQPTAPPEETRFAKYVISIMQRRKA